MDTWLTQHGLAKYAEVFAANDLDLDILALLSDDELASLGVSLGDRKRLQRALDDPIQTLGASAAPESSVPARPPAVVPKASDPVAWSRHPDDRRPVTLLFADICDSTLLTQDLDPEAAHQLLYDAVQRIGASVEQVRGTVCRFMGDGMMAMFGAPVAFESHARAACECALAIQASIRSYSKELQQRYGAGLNVRVGVHTGEVVALQVGNGARIEWDASGPAVALAARMEQTAPPGAIQLSRATYELVKDQFEAEEVEPVVAKGFSDPIAVVRLTRARATPQTASAALVGRVLEFEQMQLATRSCVTASCGQSIVIQGEAGIGKSTLCSAVGDVARQLGMSVHTVLSLDFGVQQGQAAAETLVRSLLDIAVGADEDLRRQRASAAYERKLVSQDGQVFIDDVLDLTLEPHEAAELGAMEFEVRRRQRCAALVELAEGLARQQPVLLVFEDMHWADDFAFYLVDGLIHLCRRAPVMLIATTRPAHASNDAFRTALADVVNLAFNLPPLSVYEAQMIATAAGVHDPAVVASSVRRAHGNPLFLLELLRAPGQEGLSTTVQTLVASRLDALDASAKSIAQAAAVLGQRFELCALRHVLGVDAVDLEPLRTAGMVRVQDDEGLFGHALIQEGVLASLLIADRESLHARAARWYATRDLTLSAQHLDRANDAGTARAYVEAATEQVERLRFHRALSLSARGIEIATSDVLLCELYALQGIAYRGIGELQNSITAHEQAAHLSASSELKAHHEIEVANGQRDVGDFPGSLRTLELAEQKAETYEIRARLELNRSHTQLQSGDPESARRTLDRMLEFATAAHSRELEALALVGITRVANYQCNYVELQTAWAACRNKCQASALASIEVQPMPYVAMAEMWAGRLESGREACERAIQQAPQFGDLRTTVTATQFITENLLHLLDLQAMESHHAECMRLCELTGIPVHVQPSKARNGIRLYLQGRHEEAVASLEAALDEHPVLYCRPALFGALSWATHGTRRSDECIEAGFSLLGRAEIHGHSQLVFLVYALEGAIAARQWQRVQHLAERLESFFSPHRYPLSDLMLARARLLSQLGQGRRDPQGYVELESLIDQARQMNWRLGFASLEQALESRA